MHFLTLSTEHVEVAITLLELATYHLQDLSFKPVRNKSLNPNNMYPSAICSTDLWNAISLTGSGNSQQHNIPFLPGKSFSSN